MLQPTHSFYKSFLCEMRWEKVHLKHLSHSSLCPNNTTKLTKHCHIQHSGPYLSLCSQENILWGFPGGAVVENLPANAGDTGLSPGLGGSHMPRSNWAREPQLLSLRVWSLCSAAREAATVRGPRTAIKSGPRSPQLEKALAQKRRPNTVKNK